MRFLLDLLTFPLRMRVEEAKYRLYLGLVKLVLALVVLVVLVLAVRALLVTRPLLVALIAVVVVGLWVLTAVLWSRHRGRSRPGAGAAGESEPQG